MSVPGDALASPPSGPARVIISLFIISWLAWQLMVPLSYYLGHDPDDERFSWRMFSGVWLLHRSCSLAVVEHVSDFGEGRVTSVRTIDLQRTLHWAWVGELRRNWRLVVEKFLRTRCQGDPSVSEVQFTRTCPAAPYARIPPVNLRWNCRTGAFVGP